jgi:hypothetical protein
VPGNAHGSVLGIGEIGRRPGPAGRRTGRTVLGVIVGRMLSEPSGLSGLSTFHVPVVDPGGEAQALKDSGQLLGQHDAAVMPPGAAHADRQV